MRIDGPIEERDLARIFSGNTARRVYCRNWGKADADMKQATATAQGTAEAEKQLQAFIAKFDAKDQRLIQAVRKALRKRFATANELVDDNYNFFVIGYSPTERPSDAIVSMAARANGVGLCFIHGASLPDPKEATARLRQPDAVYSP